MAGIGFSLNRLFHKKGLFNLCKAYGYAGIVTTGPMLLGVGLLVGIAFVARLGGMSDADRKLLNCMLTYGLLISLFITSWFNMAVTRFIADMLYEERPEKVMPSLWGTVSLELLLCAAAYGTWLRFSGTAPLQQLLCLWFAMTLIVVWTEMLYMTALQDYQGILLSFVICFMLGFLAALICVLIGLISIESLLLCMILSYGSLAVWYLHLLNSRFPKSSGSHFSFLRWLDKYRSLVLSGGCICIGLFSHLVLMYFGPLKEQILGRFYGASEYDVPALLAFLTLLITTVSFVTSVEVNFYPKYSSYYSLFNERGSIKDIQLVESELKAVLRRELVFLGCKQLFTTILCIVIVPPLLVRIIPGITSLSLAIFRFLCVGYATYALANSMMLIELYFEDYTGALLGTLIFALGSTGATFWQIRYGDVRYLGVGFFLGSILFFFMILLRLSWRIEKLPYYLLSRQSLVYVPGNGILAKISDKLDEKARMKGSE